MSSSIDGSTAHLRFLCEKVKYYATRNAQCIVCVDETGYPIAGVIYDMYTTAAVTCHIWIDPLATPSRAWYAAIFDFPFNRLKVSKLVGYVNSTNSEAIKLDKKFGFTLEATVKEYYEDGGDLLLLTMKRERCRILNSVVWKPIVQLVEAA